MSFKEKKEEISPLSFIFLINFLYIIKIADKEFLSKRMVKMFQLYSRWEHVDYAVRYMHHLFAVLFEDRNKEWVNESMERFNSFISEYPQDPIDIAAVLDKRDTQFIYQTAFREFSEDVDYKYDIDLSILPDFYELVKMDLREIADLFTVPYVEMYLRLGGMIIEE